jgi:hypothetical protein
MTAAGFRKLALALPETAEVGHMGHPDFRVGGKIFATLGYPDDGWAMVALPPDVQAAFVGARPDTFTPVKGAWGSAGATQVALRVARTEDVRDALRAAWRARAPKTLEASMPFKSKAQRRKFAELLVKGEISAETFEEWNRETGSAALPERVAKPKTKKGKRKVTKKAKKARKRTTRKAR